jgi:hypothetical protein
MLKITKPQASNSTTFASLQLAIACGFHFWPTYICFIQEVFKILRGSEILVLSPHSSTILYTSITSTDVAILSPMMRVFSMIAERKSG